jgi:hypothetical protein
VFLTRKNHSKHTGAFHAREGYQTTGLEATEEGISQLTPVAQKGEETDRQGSVAELAGQAFQ